MWVVVKLCVWGVCVWVCSYQSSLFLMGNNVDSLRQMSKLGLGIQDLKVCTQANNAHFFIERTSPYSASVRTLRSTSASFNCCSISASAMAEGLAFNPKRHGF